MNHKISLAVITIAFATSGCANMLESNPPQYPVDFTKRFPIELTNINASIDIYPVANSGIDKDQHALLLEFSKNYRKMGKSIITVAVPTDENGQISPSTAKLTKSILDIMRSSGVNRTNIKGETYLPQKQQALNPIKIGYLKPGSAIDGKCGLWPDDTGFGSVGTDVENLPYYNHGCATQHNIAAQIADPMDIVRPRAISPGDPKRQINVLDRWRTSESTIINGDSSSGSSNNSGSSSNSGSK